jgi:microcystin-dependent protein
MAGTIPNLPLSMQFDKDTGKPLRGGKLSFYQANTTTPQLAYKDVGLTLPHPNPLTLDGAGRVPSFYLADGFVRVRLTNARGSVQFDEASLLVIGPSAGGGGGGGSVDASSVFQTGDVLWLDASGVRAGWVRDNGRTIGSALSGASERANADCQALFTFLWQTFGDALCPVLGGRGASAAADWAADKQITLPDKRGYVPGGVDDMGSSAAGRLTGAPIITGSVTTPGALIGEAMHTLTIGEMPSHTHTQNPHSHGFLQVDRANLALGGGSAAVNDLANSGDNFSTNSATATNQNTGGGQAHNVVQRTVLGTFYRKL